MFNNLCSIMHYELFLNKLFICLINYELISYAQQLPLERVPRNFFLKCFQNNVFV